MAQTGYTPILIYSSSTASNAPSAGNLTNSTLGSELAINITDGKLFYKDNANAVQVIGWKTTPTTAGGTGLTSYSQGDLLYYNSGTTLTALAKNTTATRYLSNTGSSNNPAWAQVDLTNGVTGTLPVGNGGTGNTTGAATAVKSNATTGLMEIVGPGAGTTRVMTIPNANFTAARTDAAQSFTGVQTFGSATGQNSVFGVVVGSGGANEGLVLVTSATGKGWFGFNKANDAQIPGQFTYDFNTGLMQAFSSGSFEIVTNASGTAAVTVSTASNVTINSGNLVVGTSGKGIDFSATPGTGTSELLNDYEEGTWTPDLRFGGNKVSMTGTFTGYYTKIGRQVNVQIRIELTNKGTSTGVATIEGLPFTSLTYPAAIVDPSAGMSGLVAGGATFVGVATTTVYLFQQTTTARNQMTETNFTNTSDIRLDITYIV